MTAMKARNGGCRIDSSRPRDAARCVREASWTASETFEWRIGVAIDLQVGAEASFGAESSAAPVKDDFFSPKLEQSTEREEILSF